MPPACVCSAGDGNGKINCNTASRDDSGHCPDVGGVYGNPRPLRTPSATSPRDGGHTVHRATTVRSLPRQALVSGAVPGPALRRNRRKQAFGRCCPSRRSRRLVSRLNHGGGKRRTGMTDFHKKRVSASLFTPILGDVSHDIFDRIDPIGFAKVARGIVALLDNARSFLALFWAA
jgi:hypothetical protein